MPEPDGKVSGSATCPINISDASNVCKELAAIKAKLGCTTLWNDGAMRIARLFLIADTALRSTSTILSDSVTSLNCFPHSALI